MGVGQNDGTTWRDITVEVSVVALDFGPTFCLRLWKKLCFFQYNCVIFWYMVEYNFLHLTDFFVFV